MPRYRRIRKARGTAWTSESSKRANKALGKILQLFPCQRKTIAYIRGMPKTTVGVSAYESVSENTNQTVVSFRISPELGHKIADAALKAQMPKSSLLRLSIDRGIDRLLEQLEVTTTNTGADA
jgi:hypothetical protein